MMTRPFAMVIVNLGHARRNSTDKSMLLREQGLTKELPVTLRLIWTSKAEWNCIKKLLTQSFKLLATFPQIGISRSEREKTKY